MFRNQVDGADFAVRLPRVLKRLGEFFHLVLQAVMAESGLAVIGEAHAEGPVIGRGDGDDAGQEFRHAAGQQLNKLHGRFQLTDADAVSELAGAGRPEGHGRHVPALDVGQVDLLHAGEDDALLVRQNAVPGVTGADTELRAVNPCHGDARVNVHQQGGIRGYLAFDGRPADGRAFQQALFQLCGVHGKDVVCGPHAHEGEGLLRVEDAVAFQRNGINGEPVVFKDVVLPQEDNGPDEAEDERINGEDVEQPAPEEPETVVPALALNGFFSRLPFQQEQFRPFGGTGDWRCGFVRHRGVWEGQLPALCQILRYFRGVASDNSAIFSQREP